MTTLHPARALAGALEPFTGQVYFSRECHANYEALGFSPSPGEMGEGVAIPMRSYIRSRAWSNDDLDAAEARLAKRGLVTDGEFTDAGRAAREAVESGTDDACTPILDNLGDDLDELVSLLSGWSKAVQAGHGYPGSGPHELAAVQR